MNKTIIYSAIILLGMLGLLYLMNDTFWAVRRGRLMQDHTYLILFKMSLWGFLFGVLIEWKALKNILVGNIRVNWLITPAVLLIIIGFIPIINWVKWFGVGTPFYIEMLGLPEINVVLNITAGILFVRGLSFGLSDDRHKSDYS